MRILVIGQLPKEVGGNYTTGAANVIYELSKQKFVGCEYFTFGTNIPNDKAIAASTYPFQYIGYKKSFKALVKMLFAHPIKTLKKSYHFKMIDGENPLRLLFYEENIKNAIRKTSPDIIHVHSITNLSATHFAIEGKNTPIILTCHGIFYRGDPNDKKNKRKYHGNLKYASAYTGLTQESIIEYERFLGIDRSRVTIIPNGVDCKKFFYSVSERETLRKTYNVSNDCIVFITVASIQPRKGQFDFVKILERTDYNYQYWIIGNGTDAEIIKKYIEEHGMQSKVILLGYKGADELYKYYSAADIYAHVSKKEGQALSELEANATGLRTIVNKSIVGTIANDVNKSCYHIINMEDPDMISLNEWIESGKDDIRSSKATFDWRIIAEKYNKLYKSI